MKIAHQLTNRDQSVALTVTSSAVLNTLLYFDVFHHPLSLPELINYCQYEKAKSGLIEQSLRELLELKLISETDGYWYLAGRESIVALRAQRNARARSMEAKARRNAERISRFPFVRSVFISGSLSKGTLDEDGDIDFFIVTVPRRLWIARTLLVAYKKIFLLNSRKYFCVNYFVDTDHLEIPDQNLFVATELVFARPMCNAEIQSDLLKANSWIKSFYPNLQSRESIIPDLPNARTKNFLEKILSGKFGEWLDERFFYMTLRRWEKKFPHVDKSQFDLNFRSRKHVSKHHPQGFQEKVRKQINEKWNNLPVDFYSFPFQKEGTL